MVKSKPVHSYKEIHPVRSVLSFFSFNTGWVGEVGGGGVRLYVPKIENYIGEK
jgi:hypothetical protein